MEVVCLPLLSDNYAWVLVDEASGDCAVVDPAESRAVEEFVKRNNWRPRWILATHHHSDHVGGNGGLMRTFDGIEVFCSNHDFDAGRITGASRGVADGETISVAGEEARCLWVPGHTLGAAAYHFPKAGAVFTGDTLFGAGCGRLFEGSPAQMYASLSRLRELPPETKVYCGHEYTEKNLRFALSRRPDDAAVGERLARAREAVSAGRPTVPSTLAEECATNPFLRAADAEAFAELRRGRDRF